MSTTSGDPSEKTFSRICVCGTPPISGVHIGQRTGGSDGMDSNSHCFNEDRICLLRVQGFAMCPEQNP